MIDIQLDAATWDLVIAVADLQLVRDEDETIQHIKQRLLTFEAEWFLDLSIGLPWLSEILEKPQDINGVEVIIKDVIQGSPGVSQLTAFQIVEVAEQERAIRVDFTVELLSGTTTNNIRMELGA